MNPLESRIIPLLQKKQSKGIELLYDNYADALFGVINTIVRDDALAQDVLQETFVKIWKNGDKYDPKKSRLFTWILRVARNTAIDKLRSIRNRTAKEIQIPEYDVNISGNTSFNVEGLDVKDHLSRLEGKYQKVLQALFFLGMTQQEASDALQIPLGTVKTRLRFALKILRETYGNSKNTIIFIIMMMS